MFTSFNFLAPFSTELSSTYDRRGTSCEQHIFRMTYYKIPFW